MLRSYRQHIAERQMQNIPPKALSSEQVQELLTLIENPIAGEENFILQLFSHHVASGVESAAKVKAHFLQQIIQNKKSSPLISPSHAIDLLATMQGGYNIEPLIEALANAELAEQAADALSNTLLIFDYFDDIATMAQQENHYAKQILHSWANAEWFMKRKPVADKITLTLFKVVGETNTDDLSPADEAWSRPDIPLHALSLLKNSRSDVTPDKPGLIGPITEFTRLKTFGYPIAYVGDVVGTGSSRKSATNSILWHIGQDIPFVPNKRYGGIILAGKIAPIFFNTMEDAGALPIELDITQLAHGQIIDLYPYSGEIRDHYRHQLLANFKLKSPVLLDEVRAGGRIPLIIGQALTQKARAWLKLPAKAIFCQPPAIADTHRGYTLAQKIVGKACGVTGIRAGQYCQPKISTVGSQDTTGMMTRDELNDLACLKFSADLVLQSFCHTAAYPKPVDLEMHNSLPDFIQQRRGVALRPGDGIIHSWLNRMILPDSVGTGGDSHTRFPLGISFPAGSGLVAFAAATAMMPLDMPESVLVRFKGEMQPGITLRDLVHSIPYYAMKQGLLTLSKQDKKNIFSGRILEIEGLPNLTVEQAFELTDASAERSATACTIQLNKASIITYLHSNVALLQSMIKQGYGDANTLNLRIQQMKAWLAEPHLLVADEDAEYAAVIDIDLTKITEPLLCAPNDPDDIRPLSEVAGTKIDEVFIGSCMTNIGHFRAAGELLAQHHDELPCQLWLAPPTKMDAEQLRQEGFYRHYQRKGIRVEIPGCSLCMGNQARIQAGCTAVSTSTRNFPNRLGTNANVYLASSELATITALLGYLPSKEHYQKMMLQLASKADKVYRYLDFSNLGQRII